MKFIFFTILLLTTLTSSICYSQDLIENNQGSDMGLVYFIRGKGHAGSATAFSALIDGVRVCKLNNRSYSAHEVSPGMHQFMAQFGGKKQKKKAEIAEIEIEAGGTYYIHMTMQSSFWVNDLSPVEVTRNTALRLLKEDKIKLDKDCGDDIAPENL
jgi:hypothetical protein